jgi:hypothetical protein
MSENGWLKHTCDRVMKNLTCMVEVDRDYQFFERSSDYDTRKKDTVWNSFLHLCAGRFVRLEVVSVWSEMDTLYGQVKVAFEVTSKSQ